jgi:hypothetical protein
LIPAGVELLLASKSGFPDSPDYMPLPVEKLGHVLAIGAGLVVLAGAWRIGRIGRKTWTDDVEPLKSALVLAGATLAAGVAVSLMQRPRPSYLIACQVILIGTIAVFGRALFWTRQLAPLAESAFPILACLLVLLVPPFYPRLVPRPERRLLNIYERIRPHRTLFETGKVKLLSVEFPVELCSYLGRRRASCEPVPTGPPPANLNAAQLREFLDRGGATLAYLSLGPLQDPAVRAWVKDPAQFGWRLLSSGPEADPSWVVLGKLPPQ